MIDNVREALRDIKAMSLGHHAHEDPAVLLHALLVEIPSACDEAIAALAAPSSESPAATGSGAAPTRDDVAEVLLREAHPDDGFEAWSWDELIASDLAGIVCAVALARRQADAILAKWNAPSRGGEPVHRPGHRPPVGFNAVVEIVSTSDLEADDVIFAEGGWKCVIDDGINDSTQVMAAEIIDDAAGQGLADTAYGEWFARVVALVPQHKEPAT